MQDQEEEWLELCKQASVEQDRERLFVLVRRISELLEARDQRLRATVRSQPLEATALFQIAYDEMCLIARAELLKNSGYQADSALGSDEAKRLLDKRRHSDCLWSGMRFLTQTREEIVLSPQ